MWEAGTGEVKAHLNKIKLNNTRKNKNKLKWTKRQGGKA